jgi:type I restriction enzyme M protein
MKNLLISLGFSPKENTQDIYSKKYPLYFGYEIIVDYKKEKIEYGEKIGGWRATTANFSQDENWVVLDCVDRLLSKWYKPEDIFLEKKFTVGHGAAGGWLDILVKKEWKAYLMIECKTWWKEFDKEWQNTQKKWGQLLSYLQQDRDTEFLVLYASQLEKWKVIYRNEIIKVEEDYRQLASNTEDLYNRWNKISKQNGIFDPWTRAYHFESKALTLSDLKEIRQEDSSFIFNQFLEILRHNTVSDKWNAFNRIFTLFLCKVYDEKTAKVGEELKFQWLEWIDNHISFQIRLTDLYKNGIFEFLSKQVTDFSEDDFEKKYKHLDDSVKRSLLEDFFKVRLEKNNEFAIKDVFDHQSFEDNAKVVKEVVELLQKYRIRYNKRQQYLSDFFELLLTTGLKQESGQFFTPVPVAQFIIKSLPIDQIITEKIEKWEKNNLLPYIIDYAAGSGHFLTESMHEVQGIINQKDPSEFIPDTAKKLKTWQEDHFDWATQYVYGVEKDYRLVKVGKVGCYLHGDGLANVILSDGLARFSHKEYKGKLSETDSTFPQDNKQFDILISNPPYSVSSFANTSRSYYTEDDFALYNNLTESSSEIECLFIERMKQLLKDWGIAGIILPSSILSNSGIYMRSREMILEYFDIIAITELGSNTFMATGTNTVVLFLRRKNNYESINLRQSIDKFTTTLIDVTIDGVEYPVARYVAHVWAGVNLDDYKTLLQRSPNTQIQWHEIYLEYQKKIKANTEKEFFDRVIILEKEKLYYFVLAYPQKIILIKSGEKDAEKKFLGYEFSNRRGNEWIHPIQKGKSIDECTQMFDTESFENPDKASTYIYLAFRGDTDSPIAATMSNNVSRHSLVDMMTWDRTEFEKNISLSIKKKIKMESKWEMVKLASVCEVNPSKKEISEISEAIEASFIEMSSVSNEWKITLKENRKIKDLKKGWFTYFREDDIIIAKITPCMENGKCAIAKDLTNGIWFWSSEFHVFWCHQEKILPEYLFSLLNREEIRQIAETNMTGASGHRRVPIEFYEKLDIPLPPLDIQEKIVWEIEKWGKREKEMKKKIEKSITNINSMIRSNPGDTIKLSEVIEVISWQSPESEFYNADWIGLPFYQWKKEFWNDILLHPTTWTSQITKISVRDDILMSVRAPVGNVNFNPFEKICIWRWLAALRSKGNIRNKYLYYYLKFNQEIIQWRKWVGFESINRDEILNIVISLPPLSEQQRIVAEIEQIEAEIARLESELAIIPSEKEAILKKYL